MSNKIEELEKKLQEVENEEKIEILNQLATLLSRSNPEDAQKYGKKALDLAKKLDYKQGITGSYNVLGISNYMQGNYYKTIEYFQKALNICREIDDKKGIASFYGNIGVIHRNLGDYERALKYYIKSLKFFEELDLKINLANTYNNIGLLYRDQLQLEKALDYHIKCLKIRKKLDDHFTLATSYNNIGLVYQDQKNYKKALKYHTRALKIREENNDKKGLSLSYYNIGSIYGQQGKWVEALECYQKGLKIAEEMENRGEIVSFSNNLGHIQTDLGNYDSARKNLEKGLTLAKEIGAKAKEMEAYQYLSELFERKGDYKKSLEYHKEYARLKSIIFNEKSSEKMAEMQTRYETEKKEKEAEIYRLRNVELKEANEALQKSEERLKKLVSTKDKFFSIIAHDLKNPLSTIMGIASLLTEFFDRFSKKEIYDNIEMIKESGDNLYDLLENLLEWARAQTGRLDYHPEKSSLKYVIDANIFIVSPTAVSKKIDLHSYIPEDIMVFVDINMLSTVIRNLLSNAIKFTGVGGEIEISCKEQEDFVQISVKDTGIGIAQEDVEKLFRIDTHHTTLGTNAEKGTGLGLILCKEFIKIHGGEIWVESELGKGSRFHCTLPKHEDKSFSPKPLLSRI